MKVQFNFCYYYYDLLTWTVWKLYRFFFLRELLKEKDNRFDH